MASQTQVNEYEWRGRTGPFKLLLAPGVFTPTHTSVALAEAVEVRARDTVVDVGCGSGVLSFVAARLGAGRVIGCDISEESIEIARRNAERLGHSEVTEFRQGNMLDPVKGEAADVIIGDISGIPDDVAELTGWFPGGPTGAELPVAMLESVGDTLKRGGHLYLPTGTIQAEETVLDAARRIFGSRMEVILEREFPLASIVARSSTVMDLVSKGVVGLRQRGSRLLWRLQIWRCERD
ncbi:MAG: methyltransferase domain-containing protein [Actinomycetota bacterium]